MNEAMIKAKVNELAKWDKLAEECKREIEMLKSEFDKFGNEALKDKKIKQVEFWGDKAKVVVTESESLKVQYNCIIEQLFSAIKEGNIKIEPSYKYSKPFERILISIIQGTYLDQKLEDVIRQIECDDKAKKVLAKKLKGNWERDIKTLQKVAKMSKEDAEEIAFHVQESMNYERILALFKVAGYELGTEKFDEVMKKIKAAAIVVTSLKVGIQAADTN